MVVIIKKTIFDLLRRRVLYADKVRKKTEISGCFFFLQNNNLLFTNLI